MTGKHYNWHRAWQRDAEGRLLHTSGLRVLVARGDGYTDYEIDPASVQAFEAAESARGVAVHDRLARLQRLLREAQRWYEISCH